MIKVKELIKKLKQCDQELYIYVHHKDDLLNILGVDDSMNDRIDINVEEYEVK